MPLTPSSEKEVKPLSPVATPLAQVYRPYPELLKRQVTAVYQANRKSKTLSRARIGKQWANDCLKDIRNEEHALAKGHVRKRPLIPFKSACLYYRMIFTGLYYETKVIGYQKGLHAMVQDAEQIIALDPEFEEGGVYRVLGNIYLKTPRFSLTGEITRNLDKALAYAEQALAHGPNNSENLILMGEVLWEKRETDDALDYFQSALSDLPRAGHPAKREHALITTADSYLERYQRLQDR